MPGRTLNARKRRVFDCVFGGVVNLSQPTPVATPATGFTAPGQAFGTPVPLKQNQFAASVSPDRPYVSRRSFGLGDSEHVQDQVRWDRSWHIVTHSLKLTDFTENRGILEPLKPEGGSVGSEFYAALEDILYSHACVPYARQTEDIIVWHTSQVRNHFLHQVLPVILRARELQSPEAVLHKGLKILETAHRQYLHGLSFIKEGIEMYAAGTSAPVISKFLRDLHAIVTNSVTEPLSGFLSTVLKKQVATILGLASARNSHSSSIQAEGDDTEKARREMLGLVESFKNVGLAGEQFQVIFAEIMSDAITEYVDRACKEVWSTGDHATDQKSSIGGSVLRRAAHNASPSRCVTDLCEWIENRYAKLVVQTLNILNTKANVSWADKEKYKEMSIGRLAELRINELFDIVTSWPNGPGALEDLRTAITTPQRRLHLTEVFAKNLNQQVLHPGVSTLQILQTYISMIWSFHALDHSKVLLDRVAFPLQLYLCSREDTARIIVTGLLAEVQDESGKPVSPSGDKLFELARLLNDPSEQVGTGSKEEGLDWHDMDWVPDPVDAGPGYKRTKSADVIGTLIGVLGSQEVFIKEFQHVIADSMLRLESQNIKVDKEKKVLELLQARFGEASLQACQVMIRDIKEYDRLDAGIVFHDSRIRLDREVTLKPQYEPLEDLKYPGFNAKVLSRLFWPQLQDESFRIPQEIAEIQKAYEEGFEREQSNRKLTWLQSQGLAIVELALEDRLVRVEGVHTWQATVIYAFQSESGEAAQRTVQQLVDELEMSEPLVRSALKFWVNKLVLHETSPSTFTVLETLNQDDRLRSKTATESGPSTSASAGDMDNTGADAGMGSLGMAGPKEQMYWQFIQGMLKNGAKQMALMQIAMTLKMLISEGFPYSNEELKGFLDGKVAAGKLEVKGGKYKLKK